jgi:hypothetical protein
MKLTSHVHLALRLRIHAAIPPLPHMPSWHKEAELLSLKVKLLKASYAQHGDANI